MTEISTTTLPAAPAQPSVPRLTIPRRLGAPSASPASAPETTGSAPEASPEPAPTAEPVAESVASAAPDAPKRRGRPKGSAKASKASTAGTAPAQFGFHVAVVAPPFQLSVRESGGQTTTQDVWAEGGVVTLAERDPSLQAPLSAIELKPDAARALHAWLGAYFDALQTVK